ncbi:hypothetical protein Mpsy_0130 [Methanolobus psychrophilus R15]|nr:hypothetical protein Mpsy_0130 [Methanolobus psychrophilus R15]
MKHQRPLIKLLLKKIVILQKMYKDFKNITIIKLKQILGLGYFLLTS